MNILVLLAVAAASPTAGARDGCTPPAPDQRIQMVFHTGTGLPALTDWARKETCVDYTFAAVLSDRKTLDETRMSVTAADASVAFELLLHTMNLGVERAGRGRKIVATGVQPDDPRLAELAVQIVKLDATHYRVGRDVYNALITEGTKWFKAVPEAKDGKQGSTSSFQPAGFQPVGHRLSSIKPAGIPARLGFANGDLVKSVAGVALIGPSELLEAYTKTRQADRMTFKIVRAGREMAIEWQLVESARPSAAAHTPDRQSLELTAQIQRRDDTHYTVTRAALVAALEGGGLVTRTCRIVPEMRDGKTTGFRLFSIKPGSVPDAIGLANGDVVVAINGVPMTSPDNTTKIYEARHTMDALRFSIVHNGRPVTIEVKVER